VGKISEKDYGAQVQRAIRLLEGRGSQVLDELHTMMAEASEREDYERAAVLRDRIRALEAVNEQQKVTDPESNANRDIVHMARGESADGKASRAVVVVLNVREGRAVGVFQYPFENVDPDMASPEVLFEFLSQYYLSRSETSSQLLPREVLLPEECEVLMKDQIRVLESALGRAIEFRIPRRGEALELVSMVKKTADHRLTDIASRVGSAMEDLNDVHYRLALERFPSRIECYDISHFQGEGTVASRVVFLDGRPEKDLYRRYHVREVTGVDDFGSLREVLGRRFENDQSLPDLVVIDGGKGQLSQAEAIFKELGVVGVDLVSIAKARTERDFGASEVKASFERIFKPGQKNPIMLKPATGAFRVLTQVRDEAHRFAITFHRKVRAKKRVSKRKSNNKD
ncbi:MAG TPA: UvrB/UvrC motif-containing protein, partial [Oligoflexia bacterium]|nr:UvrB/UvrC motif-containing protein [Oligoflexia bacterium]